MANDQIDYEAVLADLKSRRDALENAIAGIEKILGIAASNGTMAMSTDSRTYDVSAIPSDAFFGLSIPDAIKKCLAMLKRKQSVKVIEEALGRGGLNTTARNFYSTVYSTLVRMERAGDVVKVDTDWGLPEWYPGMRKDRLRKKSQGTAEDNPPTPPPEESKAAPQPETPSMRTAAREVLAKAGKALTAAEIARQLALAGHPVSSLASLQAGLGAMVKHKQIRRESTGYFAAL